MSPLWPSVPTTALYFLYVPSFPFRPSPSIISTTLCFFSSPLSPLQLSVHSTALCPLYGPLSPVQPYVPYKALSPVDGLCPPSTILCTLYGPLPPVWPSVSYLCPICGPLSSLRPSVLYGSLSPLSCLPCLSPLTLPPKCYISPEVGTKSVIALYR
jgi:hypothetical protein